MVTFFFQTCLENMLIHGLDDIFRYHIVWALMETLLIVLEVGGIFRF